MFLRVAPFLTAIAAGFVLSSCSGSPPAVITPEAIAIVSGNAQTGVVGAELESPVVVRVTDKGGTPAAGALVTFSTISGSGSLYAGSAISGVNGLARDRWTLGTGAGPQRLEARLLDPKTGSTVASAPFDATALAGPPAAVSLVAGDGQSAQRRTALPRALEVMIADAYGNPVASTEITFVADPADGTATPATTTTNALGKATTTWTLGAAAGVQVLKVVLARESVATFTATARPTLAETSDIAIVRAEPGVTPFISFVTLSGTSVASLSGLRYRIAPKDGAVSKPVGVRYSMAALTQRRYAAPGEATVVLPVFGLYSGRLNHVTVALQFQDGSTQDLPADITTASYTDPNGVYDQPTILKNRAAGSALGFDFFFMKSNLGTPVVVDTDAEIRWVGIGVPHSPSTLLDQNAFIIGAADSTKLTRLELDGSMNEAFVRDPNYTNFHHNIDPGKQGWLAEFDVLSGGIRHIESTLAEIAPNGAVVDEWDVEALLGEYMLKNGDDPAAFVRPGADWFHMNAATYDPQDDSLIVSSRENFVIKIDRATGDVIWIFGDPTKYWYTFPSLRSKAIALADGGLYPIGQHAVSLTPDGFLLLFNDGGESFNQPSGQPPGLRRTYSSVSAYDVDPTALTAREVWRFDNDQTILCVVCSSAYQAPDGSVLISYAVADSGAHARIVGLDSTHNVAFDFQYSNPSACSTSWNAQSIPLDDLVYN